MTIQTRLSDALEATGNWLYDWQTLVSGLLAISAGALTAVFLHKQISQTERHEKKRIDRAHQAARATLPLTLSGICSWARAMAIELSRAKAELANAGAAAFAGQFAPPDPPDENINQIQIVIQTTDERSVTEPLAEIIRELQTLWSRAMVLNDEKEMRARIGISENIDGFVIQAAQIYALTESLFDYARAKTSKGPETVEWDRINQFLMVLAIETRARFDIVEQLSRDQTHVWPRRHSPFVWPEQ